MALSTLFTPPQHCYERPTGPCLIRTDQMHGSEQGPRLDLNSLAAFGGSWSVTPEARTPRPFDHNESEPDELPNEDHPGGPNSGPA